MLYRFLKIPARIAFYFYCRRLVVNDKNVFSSNGPLLIAANHPNSFLDAIILATLFNKPITSLVRGDVYKGKFIVKFLRALNMIPVFRISEGSENLGQNYETFLACMEIFRKNGIVKIKSVSDICEMDMMMVEYFTTKDSGPYSGLFLKSSRNVSPYMLVNCKAAPSNMEKRKNKAILYLPNSLKACRPNCSTIPAFLAMVFCGGHLGKVKEKSPKIIAAIPPIINWFVFCIQNPQMEF